MSARSRSRTLRMTSETCCWSSGGTSSRSARRRTTRASSSSRVSGRGSSAAWSRASPARRSAAACAAWTRSRSSESGSGRAIEGHVQGAVVERGAGGPVFAQRGRQHQRALVTVDADHELEADLLQRDVALLGEGQVHAQLGRVGADHELLREPLVKDGARSTGTGAKADWTSSSAASWRSRQAPKYGPTSSGKTRLTTTASVRYP